MIKLKNNFDLLIEIYVGVNLDKSFKTIVSKISFKRKYILK